MEFYWSYPEQIWYPTPERRDPAAAFKGLMDPSDLWVSTEAPDWVRVHFPDLQASVSPFHGCWKHLKDSATPLFGEPLRIYMKYINLEGFLSI